MTLTRETIEEYHGMPIAGVSSNDPYAVRKQNPEDAVIRRRARDAFIDGSDASYAQEGPIDEWSSPTYPIQDPYELKNAEYPNINFPRLNSEEFKNAERSLLQMLEQIINDAETDEATKDVAYEQIATKLAEIYRHLEVIRGLGQTGARQEVSRERAGDMTMEIFGEPDKQVFDQYLAKERTQALAALNSSDQLRTSVAREFLALTGDVEASGEEVESLELHDETMEAIVNDLDALFPGFNEFRNQVLTDPVGPQESLVYFNQALALVGLVEKGWTSELSDGSAAEINEDDKKIYIGRNRAPYASNEMLGVAAHEALHALRGQNTREQADPIKRRALPGNMLVEEGIMTCIEQAINGTRRVAGLPFYMSLGLQLGLDLPDSGRRSFRGTHEIMWRRSLLQKASERDMISEQDIRNAKNNTYQTVIRTKRGNSLDARDISYYTGGRKATQWFNGIAQLPQKERLKKITWMLSGKFDITNSVQGKLYEESASQQE